MSGLRDRKQLWAARRAVVAALRAIGVTFNGCAKMKDVAAAAWMQFGGGNNAPSGKSASQKYLIALAPRLPAVSVQKPVATKAITVEGVDVRSIEFLTTRAWRTLRYRAIQENGNFCQCCGSGPANGRVINVDHIKPRKTHPRLALEIKNLQVLCGLCNAGKGNWDSTDWRQPSEARSDPVAIYDLATLRELRHRGLIDPAPSEAAE